MTKAFGRYSAVPGDYFFFKAYHCGYFLCNKPMDSNPSAVSAYKIQMKWNYNLEKLVGFFHYLSLSYHICN